MHLKYVYSAAVIKETRAVVGGFFQSTYFNEALRLLEKMMRMAAKLAQLVVV